MKLARQKHTDSFGNWEVSSSIYVINFASNKPIFRLSSWTSFLSHRHLLLHQDYPDDEVDDGTV